MSEFTIHSARKRGELEFKKEKGKYYYNPEDIKKIEFIKYKNHVNR